MPTFDGPTLTITLDAPTAGVLNVNVQANLYSAAKLWARTSDNAKFPFPFRTVGGDELTPGVQAGAYFFLQTQTPAVGGYARGWRIISSDEDQTINYAGNLVSEDATLPLIIPTPGRSVLHLGLQPVTQRVDEILTQAQAASFNGVVAIDVLSSNTGTAYPNGTQSTPVNNIADAQLIADNLGVQSFVFRGNLTLDRDLPNWSFTGLGSEKTDSVNLAGFNVNASRFTGCGLSGSHTGNIEAIECDINVVTGLQGMFRRCGLTSNITLAAGSEVIFANCFSEVAGTGSPAVDMNGAASVSFRNYSGGIEVQGMTNATTASIDLDPGTINMTDDVSNIGGSLQVRGLGWKNISDAVVAQVDIQDRLFDIREAQIALASLVGNINVSLDDETVSILDKNLNSLRDLSVSTDGRIRRIL